MDSGELNAGGCHLAGLHDGTGVPAQVNIADYMIKENAKDRYLRECSELTQRAEVRTGSGDGETALTQELSMGRNIRHENVSRNLGLAHK